MSRHPGIINKYQLPENYTQYVESQYCRKQHKQRVLTVTKHLEHMTFLPQYTDYGSQIPLQHTATTVSASVKYSRTQTTDELITISTFAIDNKASEATTSHSRNSYRTRAPVTFASDIFSIRHSFSRYRQP